MNTKTWLNRFARPWRRDGAWATISALVFAALLLVPPLLTRILVNRVLIGDHVALLWPLIGAAIGFSILRGISGYAQAYLSERMGQGVLRAVRQSLYRHLTGLSFTYYDNVQTGQLISRLTSDVEWVRMYYSNFYTQGANVVFTLAFIILAISVLDWRLGLLLLILMPPLALLIRAFDTRVRPAFRQIRAQFAVMTTQLQETVSGVRVVKAFAQEPREMKTFDETLDVLFDRNMTSTRLWSTYFPLFDLLGGIYGVLVFLYGGYQAIHHTISVGTLVAVAAYALMLVQPLRQLGQVLNLAAQSGAAGQRLFELSQVEADIAPPQDRTPYRPEQVEGTVEFENVHFGYSADGIPALTDITLKVPVGRSLAILGGTGSGKTSLVSLIARLYDVSSGRVLVDGVDVRNWDPVHLRHHIGFVLQESFLFSASVRDNIAFGRPDATLEEVMEAARVAMADEFIRDLPYGYDTVVGERGVGLSGGQRQRIAIARALLVNPPIVILDDATASVDQETEAAIQEAMAHLLAGRTAIVIAHRLSSLKAADEIVVLEHGRIAERGTHNDLVLHSGIYREIFEVQYRDQERIRGGQLA
ncbi:MAG: ABC transporter ATP-binding protein/permease [Firmicutes bacterium]|nr:ABC transporter ATP-binding protein/permease [Bacillota bacterium]